MVFPRRGVEDAPSSAERSECVVQGRLESIGGVDVDRLQGIRRADGYAARTNSNESTCGVGELVFMSTVKKERANRIARATSSSSFARVLQISRANTKGRRTSRATGQGNGVYLASLGGTVPDSTGDLILRRK